MTHLLIQLRGNPQVLVVAARSVVEDNDNAQLLAKDARGQVIGKFNMGDIAGWWTEDRSI